MAHHLPDPATATLLRSVRERRLAEGLHCPRCEAERVVRWGSFAGRQRYRCHTCRRTFSDLTATPLSYLKRLDAWPAYFRALAASQPVRRAATAAHVAVSTAFRWRHLILEAIGDLDRTTLAGLVEVAETSFRYSEKGRHPGGQSAWTASLRAAGILFPGCTVIVAQDRSGGHRAERLATGVRTGALLRTVLEDMLAGDATLLCSGGRFGPYAQLQRPAPGGKRRVIFVDRHAGAGLEPYHNRNARRWLGRLRGWLVPFRGVATRYLPNYLVWRRMLDLIEDGPWLEALLPSVARPPSTNTS